jgi:hypothetical protein
VCNQATVRVDINKRGLCAYCDVCASVNWRQNCKASAVPQKPWQLRPSKE